jgi:hypothetical protein
MNIGGIADIWANNLMMGGHRGRHPSALEEIELFANHFRKAKGPS